jgi:transcriptional regulator with XRE-family HTH domain
MGNTFITANGSEIKKLRQSRAMTQRELAKAASCSKRTIERAESSEPINPKILALIAKALGRKSKSILKVAERNTASGQESNMTELKRVREFFDAMANDSCRASRQDVQKTFSAFLARFQASYGQIKVLGMDRPVPLKSIFTSVRLSRYQPYYTANFLKLNPNMKYELHNPFSLINKYANVRIMGGPGAGKSTLLKRITLRLLEDCCSGELNEGRVPIYFELRKLSNINKPFRAAIVDELKAIGFPSPEEFLRFGLEAGKFVFLLDGADEMSNDIRESILDEIERLGVDYSTNHFIVSCRDAFYWNPSSQFNDFLLLGFSNKQIHDFISRWADNSSSLHKQSYSAIWATLSRRENNKVLEMARTPLLLTFICIAYDQSYGLPENRSLLCKRALEIMLSKWSAEKRLRREAIFAGLHSELEVVMLGEIAVKMLTEGRNDCTKSEVLDMIRSFLIRELGADRRLNAEQIFELIEVQQGIFVQAGLERYTFCYEAFRDYLAAIYFKENAKIDLLTAKWLSRSTWRDPILMAAGLMTAEPLLQGVSRNVGKWIKQHKSLNDFLIQLEKVSIEGGTLKASIAKRAEAFAIILNLMTMTKLTTSADTRTDSWFVTMLSAAKTSTDVAACFGRTLDVVDNTKRLPKAEGKQSLAKVLPANEVPNVAPSPISLLTKAESGVLRRKRIDEIMDEIEDYRNVREQEASQQNKQNENVGEAYNASIVVKSESSREGVSQSPSDSAGDRGRIMNSDVFRESIQSFNDKILSSLGDDSNVTSHLIYDTFVKYICWINRNHIFKNKIDETIIDIVRSKMIHSHKASLISIRATLSLSIQEIMRSLGCGLTNAQPTAEELLEYVCALELLLQIKANALSVSIECWEEVSATFFASREEIVTAEKMGVSEVT